MSETLDLVIIGAGPSGLACAIEARNRGLSLRVIEKGCIVNSIYRFPENMTFFTTAELLEVGNIPFTVRTEKPVRLDALKYYRRVVQQFDLPIRDFEKVLSVQGSDGDFLVETEDRLGERRRRRTQKVIVAVGYYDNPNRLNVPGEDLSKVSHYYTDPHPYYRKKVAVIGGKNSAAIAALELFRNGADVTLIHRGAEMRREVKYWILPDINNRIQSGEIPALFQSRVSEIRPAEIVVETPDGTRVLENDFVFALTGYRPDVEFLRSMGVEVDSKTCIPRFDPETLESNVPGIYLGGSVISGRLTNKIFIENGRFHGERIFPHLQTSLRSRERSRIQA